MILFSMNVIVIIFFFLFNAITVILFGSINHLSKADDFIKLFMNCFSLHQNIYRKVKIFKLIFLIALKHMNIHIVMYILKYILLNIFNLKISLTFYKFLIR